MHPYYEKRAAKLALSLALRDDVSSEVPRGQSKCLQKKKFLRKFYCIRIIC